MRREPEFFGEQELVLVYMAARLKHALALEAVLDQAAIDYAVVTGNFTSGILFRFTRVGAFFDVPSGFADTTRALIRQRGFKPYS
jgi:hypothetical protein